MPRRRLSARAVRSLCPRRAAFQKFPLAESPGRPSRVQSHEVRGQLKCAKRRVWDPEKCHPFSNHQTQEANRYSFRPQRATPCMRSRASADAEAEAGMGRRRARSTGAASLVFDANSCRARRGSSPCRSGDTIPFWFVIGALMSITAGQATEVAGPYYGWIARFVLTPVCSTFP